MVRANLKKPVSVWIEGNSTLREVSEFGNRRSALPVNTFPWPQHQFAKACNNAEAGPNPVRSRRRWTGGDVGRSRNKEAAPEGVAGFTLSIDNDRKQNVSARLLMAER